jgi:hypothetical protein
LGKRIERLREWGHAVVHSNLAAIARSDATSVVLAEYLEAVSGADRDDRFDELVASMALDIHAP